MIYGRDWKLYLLMIFAAMTIAGIVSAVQNGKDKAEYDKGVLDFNQLTEDQLEVGRFVKGTVSEIYGEFAYTESYDENFLGMKSNEHISENYYIVPLTAECNDYTGKVFAINVRNRQVNEQAVKIMEETWDFMDGNESPTYTTMEFTGRIERLEGDLLDYLYEYMMDGDPEGTREEYSQIIAPYVIKYYAPDSVKSVGTSSMVIIFIGIIGTALMAYIKFFRSRNINRSVQPVNIPVQEPSAPAAPEYPTFPTASSAPTAPKAPAAPAADPLAAAMGSTPAATKAEKPAQSAVSSGEMESIDISDIKIDDM